MSSEQDSGDTATTHNGDELNLRVTYLHAGNPRPPHNVGTIAADTTIASLKQRLQIELLETPTPEEQRLIYQGRPLLQDAMTLREALRIEGPVGPLPYTLHIVIQPRQAGSQFRPPPTESASQTLLPNDGTQTLQASQAAHQTMHQDAHNQALRVQAMAQAHLNMLQHQLANITQQQGMGVQALPQFSATFVNGQQVPNSAVNAMPPMQAPLHGMATPQNQGATARQPHPMQQGGGGALPNGPAHAGQPHIPTPLPRPLSVPPQPRAGDPHQIALMPHQPMLGAVQPPPGFGLPLPPIRSQPIHVSQPTHPTVWLASSQNGPEALLFAPGHGYFSSNPSRSSDSARRSDQVRQVQEALTARNGTSTRPAASGTAPAGDPAAPARNQADGQVAVRQPAGQLPAPPAQVARNPNEDLMGLVIQRGWLFLRLYMFTYVLSEPNTWRRYLLLSLALLVCLLPRENPLNRTLAAARRHIDNLIGPPAPQPRPAAAGQAAPANQAAPVDGTPAGPPAPRGAVTTTPEEVAARILRERHEQQRQRAQRNPNVLRDLLYRVEQALALFLASLIPGVGERHVAAREEQRRLELQAEVDRLNAERERTEAAAAAISAEQRDAAAGSSSELITGQVDAPPQNTPGDSKGDARTTSPSTTSEPQAATSTAVEASGGATDEQLRSRQSTRAQASETQ